MTEKTGQTMEPEQYDVVIIGGGPAGLTAGIYAMRAALNTVLIEKTATGGQVTMSDEVENWPGIENINGAQLSMNFTQHAQSYGLEIISDEVAAVEPGLEYHKVVLSGGRTFLTHAVVLATGGSPRKLQIPGEDEYYGKGISYCAVCDGFFFKGKTVCVVGGGDTACEEALYLAKLAEKVYLIHRRDELRASTILQERVKKECKIEILWNTVPTEVVAEENAVAGVTLKDTQTGETKSLAVDGVFIFVGYEPNNHLVPAGVKMTANGYVEADATCATNIPGVYVAGDLKEKYARQIITAASDGCTASLAAAHFVEEKKARNAEACELPASLLNEA